MFQRDYLLRLIGQFSEAIGAIMGFKRKQQPQEAVAAAGETYKRLFGLNPNLVHALSERDLIEWLSREGEASGTKLLILAALLKEEADLHDMLGRTEASFRLRLKALRLFLAAPDRQPETDFLEVAAEIDALTEKLDGFDLPAETKLLLWRHYAGLGRFADAEDVLFELLEAVERTDMDGDPALRNLRDGDLPDGDLLKEAKAFYEHLLTLDDAALEAGNLPRSEVLEALETLEALRKKQLSSLSKPDLP